MRTLGDLFKKRELVLEEELDLSTALSKMDEAKKGKLNCGRASYSGPVNLLCNSLMIDFIFNGLLPEVKVYHKIYRRSIDEKHSFHFQINSVDYNAYINYVLKK